MVTKNGKKDIKLIITEEQINLRIDQIEKLDCDDDLRRFLIDALEALVALDRIVGLKNTTIARLRKIFNKQSEKRPAELNQGNKNDEGDKNKSHPRGNNHGKNGKAEYPNADKICHAHENLKFGEKCPECGQGTLGRWEPGVYIRITGSPSFRATVHETEKFRCNACQKIFEAHFAGKKADKYDSKALAILGILKYRASMPFYRIEKLQKQLLTPMPASTQWDLIEKLANSLNAVWLALIKYASNGHLYFIDDTKAKILDLIRENKEKKEKDVKKFRKGIYTTCIVSEIENYKVVLYLTGRKYAAENLNEILNHRDHTDPPIVSSDAASTNNIHDHLVIKALCNVHSRRNFFDLGERFKEESEKVLDLLKTVFKYERETKEGEFSGEQRLAYHQEKSLPLMNELKLWMDLMIEEKKTEPNSSLGQAISYCQKNWQDLMAFTRIANAPLHNNLVEERLRQVVINRKNWNFYKTQLGALVGDIILGMIKTAEENGVNAFDYLVWVQENQAEVIKNPNLFFPWNFVKATPV